VSYSCHSNPFTRTPQHRWLFPNANPSWPLATLTFHKLPTALRIESTTSNTASKCGQVPTCQATPVSSQIPQQSRLSLPCLRASTGPAPRTAQWSFLSESLLYAPNLKLPHAVRPLSKVLYTSFTSSQPNLYLFICVFLGSLSL
jgi:hypothetical protein